MIVINVEEGENLRASSKSRKFKYRAEGAGLSYVIRQLRLNTCRPGAQSMDRAFACACSSVSISTFVHMWLRGWIVLLSASMRHAIVPKHLYNSHQKNPYIEPKGPPLEILNIKPNFFRN